MRSLKDGELYVVYSPSCSHPLAPDFLMIVYDDEELLFSSGSYEFVERLAASGYGNDKDWRKLSEEDRDYAVEDEIRVLSDLEVIAALS